MYNRVKSAMCLFAIVPMILFCHFDLKAQKKDVEAREDAKAYAKAIKLQSKINTYVYPDAETDPVPSSAITDDTADDPAIWYNKNNPEESIIYGSNKDAGIHAYNSGGKEKQFTTCGAVNNIDIRQGIKFGGNEMDILAGSHRTLKAIVLYQINAEGLLDDTMMLEIDLGDFAPYGFCLYQSHTDTMHAFVNDKNGEIRQYTISHDIKGDSFITDWRYTKRRPTQVEGMVVDDANAMLYVGEEEGGIFKFDLNNPADSTGTLIDGSTMKSNKKYITYDIEGLALFEVDGSPYLLASSQGNFSYAIFDLTKNEYLTSFVIAGKLVDGVGETDGLDIIQRPLGKYWPDGMLVVQDGFNSDGPQAVAQNFKYVEFGQIEKLVRKIK